MLKIETEIIEQSISKGNEVLYDLCENSWQDSGYLSAQLWLIGRSYAASPERRSYGLGKEHKPKFSNSGNGLDTFFDKLAEELLKNEDYKTVMQSLYENKDKGYKFENEEDDLSKIVNVIQAVEKLNDIIKQVRYKIDENDIKKEGKECLEKAKEKQSNLISFCSKFLHFHAPKIVFIIDSITASNFKRNGKNYEFRFKDGEESEIKISNDDVEKLYKEIKKRNKDCAKNNYGKHCVREYLLAKELQKRKLDAGLTGNASITRIVDTYMLMANREWL